MKEKRVQNACTFQSGLLSGCVKKERCWFFGEMGEERSAWGTYIHTFEHNHFFCSLVYLMSPRDSSLVREN